MVKVVLDTSTGMDLTQDDDTFEVVKDGEVMLGGQLWARMPRARRSTS